MHKLLSVFLSSLLGAILFSVTTLAAAEITEARAKEIALAKTGGGTVTECKLDYEHGRQVYEIEIRRNGWEYEVDIDATTGNIVKYKKERDD